MDAEKCWFYIVKVLKKIDPKVPFSVTKNNLNQLLAGFIYIRMLILRPYKSEFKEVGK